VRSEEERRRERLHIRRFVKRGTERKHLHCVFLLLFSFFAEHTYHMT
jgi:hypothetical protein